MAFGSANPKYVYSKQQRPLGLLVLCSISKELGGVITPLVVRKEVEQTENQSLRSQGAPLPWKLESLTGGYRELPGAGSRGRSWSLCPQEHGSPARWVAAGSAWSRARVKN